MVANRRRPSPLVLHLAAALVAAVVAGSAARAAGFAVVVVAALVWVAALVAVLATGWLVARRTGAPARPARLLRGSRVFE